SGDVFARHEVDRFWEQLLPHWNRGPVLIKRPFSKPFIDDQEFLSFLHQWGDEARDGKRVASVQMIDAGVLPRREDRSLTDFERRIAAGGRGTGICTCRTGSSNTSGAVG